MYSIRFTEQADADLLAIYIYTYNTWNEAQAIKYTDGLKTAVNKLAENPERLGTVDRSTVRPGYRSYRYQSHLGLAGGIRAETYGYAFSIVRKPPLTSVLAIRH